MNVNMNEKDYQRKKNKFLPKIHACAIPKIIKTEFSAINFIYFFTAGPDKTLYRWHPKEEQSIYDGFQNTIKDRYKDRMRTARKHSAKLARAKEHIIVNIADSIHILKDFNPKYIPDGVWRSLCKYWDTPEWKLSASGTKNRNSSDGSGKTGRHTGGSIGMNEHRDRLRLMLGREPTWEEVYLQTRLTAESKARYFAGDHTNLQFLSKKAEDSYVICVYQFYILTILDFGTMVMMLFW
ncbi:hypothetical protein L2E82_25215 [Cichorium intybus]|uniref:Uncharacterized protein n=1 Tax=Cichorium intybus TaxID=13427 RepID=A0ACB9E2N9_CICIN|nr:hypothetical protein L2E82_25215 [Cichorium intybus]